jgi:hypothetical protein
MGNTLPKLNQEHFSIVRKENVENVYEDVQNVINDTIMEDAQSCGLSTQINQVIGVQCPEGVVGIPKVLEVSGTINQNAVAKIIRECYQNSDKASSVANKIANKLQQKASLKGSGLDLIIWGDTENKTSFQTYMTNKLVAMAKQPCDVTVGVNQSVQFGCPEEVKITGTISQSANITTSGDCTQISKTISDIANEITRDVSQEATSGENWSDILIAAGVVLGLIAIIIFAMMFARGGKKSEQDRRKYGRGETNQVDTQVIPQKNYSFGEMQLSYDY